MSKLYKKIDKSALEGRVTIPKDLWKIFMGGRKMKNPSKRDVIIKWGSKYKCSLYFVRPKQPYMMINYKNNKKLIKKLRETFIYSYIIFKSGKEKADKMNREQFRSKNKRGDREVLIFEPVNYNQINLKVFIRIKDEWDTLFKRLANQNVFGLIFDKEGENIIIESTGWLKLSDYKTYKHYDHVIYYLADTNNELLYIGKADNFGKRVTPNTEHQGMPSTWNKFRLDVLNPEFAYLLERIEDHTIRSYSSVLKNNKNPSSLKLGYTLVNKNWKKL